MLRSCHALPAGAAGLLACKLCSQGQSQHLNGELLLKHMQRPEDGSDDAYEALSAAEVDVDDDFDLCTICHGV